MVKHISSVYHNVVKKNDEAGNLQHQTIIDVDRLRDSDFLISDELRIQIKIAKIVDGEFKMTYIQFDGLDDNVKQALSDMYFVIDEFMLKEGLNYKK
jgi:hypothetical protein